MSERLAVSDSQRYLGQIFSLNPLEQAAEILSLRRSFLRIPRPADRLTPEAEGLTDPAALSEQRERTRQQLKKIQSEFWQLSHESLASLLDGVSQTTLPEFRPLIHRLKIVASCRSEFQKLLVRKDTDTHLVSAFRAAVTLSPDKATGARERLIYGINSTERLKKAKSTVRLIQTEYPILFKLEQDWFNTILKSKLKKGEVITTPFASREFSFDFGGYGWVFAVIFATFLRILFGILT